MKKFLSFSVLILFALLIFPQTSQARLVGYEVQSVVAWGQDDEECAAEGTITDIEGGFITGNEGLFVNGALWGSLSDIGRFSGFSVGDKISFGTLKLEARLNYDFDVTLDTDICKNLQPDDQVEFRGTDGVTDQFNLLEPMLNYAQALDNNLMFIPLDLTQNSLWFTNLDGIQTTIGNGPMFTPGGGTDMGGNGCSLNAAIPQASSLFYITGLAVLMGGFGWFRRKK